MMNLVRSCWVRVRSVAVPMVVVAALLAPAMLLAADPPPTDVEVTQLISMSSAVGSLKPVIVAALAATLGLALSIFGVFLIMGYFKKGVRSGG